MTKTEQRWDNKMVGHADVDPVSLIANDKNWRTHPLAQKEALAATIGEVGFLRSVTVNKRTDRIVDGHLRVKLALERGEPLVPVEYVDLTEAEEAKALLLIDPLAGLAEVDKVRMDALLREVHSGEPAIQELLAQMATDAGLYVHHPARTDPDEETDEGGESDDGESEDTEETPDVPEETSPVNICYTIVFDTKAQQEQWYGFLKELRESHPDLATAGARLSRFLNERKAG